jgi:hypothetical protein
LRQAQLIGVNFWGATLRKSRLQGSTRLAVLPYVALGKIFFPIQKVIKKQREKREQQNQERVNELVKERAKR